MSKAIGDGLAISNPERQAIAPLKGFDYQIWQSLYRWVSLTQDEVLFLEAAEDLDIIRAGETDRCLPADNSTGAEKSSPNIVGCAKRS